MRTDSEVIESLLLFPISLKGCDSISAYSKIFSALGKSINKHSILSSQDYSSRQHWIHDKNFDFVLVEEEPGVFSELLFALAPEIENKIRPSSYYTVTINDNKICLKELKSKFHQLRKTLSIV